MPGGSSLTASSPPAGTNAGARRPVSLLRWGVVGAAIVTVVGGVVALLAIRANGPVEVALPQPAAAQAAACGDLSGRLPARLDGRGERPTRPSSPLVHAWGDPAIVLFCGVDRPAELTATSELTTVNGLSWLPVEEDRSWRLTAIGRSAYVEVVVPKSVGAPTDPLIDLAGPILAAIPAADG
jgi:Protein of unknown function (DUF3515)